ncbi:hypothetical protein KSP40_PGU013096 [Platanthera guangdongensis]|uniref:Uncharacterized protein n=1 Tax=Platanthera guangdongensis TaxID=2320717 RepID=A0ABR2MXS5_9ASPA
MRHVSRCGPRGTHGTSQRSEHKRCNAEPHLPSSQRSHYRYWWRPAQIKSTQKCLTSPPTRSLPALNHLPILCILFYFAVLCLNHFILLHACVRSHILELLFSPKDFIVAPSRLHRCTQPNSRTSHLFHVPPRPPELQPPATSTAPRPGFRQGLSPSRIRQFWTAYGRLSVFSLVEPYKKGGYMLALFFFLEDRSC